MAAPAKLWRHPWVRHLRLGFNLLLAPIYLWGVLLAGGSLARAEVWVGFVALHVFLYGGTNAFNTYYDRDEGPIGGMLHPPAVDEGLLPFSLAFQAVGLPLALIAGLPFAAAWLALFAVFTAYSHPAVRLKARPAAALAAIALGQGGVGFLAGWLAAGSPPSSLARPDAILGAVTTCVLLTGLYIVTQSYQVDEDRRRGDLTLPVVLGPRAALRVAVAILAIGGAAIVAFVVARFGGGWGIVLAVGFAAGGGWLLRFAARFDPADVAGNFHRVMGFSAAASALLAAFILWHMLA